jgi:hypothetical protein
MSKKIKRFITIDTIIRNRKGNVILYRNSTIPSGHPDYNKTIEKEELDLKTRKLFKKFR